jgi:hypothetical protein
VALYETSVAQSKCVAGLSAVAGLALYAYNGASVASMGYTVHRCSAALSAVVWCDAVSGIQQLLESAALNTGLEWAVVHVYSVVCGVGCMGLVLLCVCAAASMRCLQGLAAAPTQWRS